MGRPPRVLVDTSVLIAGPASETGASNAVLALAEAGILAAVICPQVAGEAERNLGKKLPAALPEYRRFMAMLAPEMAPTPSEEQMAEASALFHSGDAPIVAAAAAARVDVLVTLDWKHLLADRSLAKRLGLMILSPGELLALLRDRLDGTPPD